MRHKRWCTRAAGIWLGMCLVAVIMSGQEVDWLPVPSEDLALEDNPASPGSEAMILLRREVRDDAKSTWDHYYRVKIFTGQGLRHGDIEIPFAPKRVLTK